MLRRNSEAENGTVLLWSVGMFGISLLVLGVLISIASYFSQTREFQSQLEIASANSSDQLDFTNFYISGAIEDVTFDETSLIGGINAELATYVHDHGKYAITFWKVDGREFWLELSKPWESPFGNFAVLPKNISARVHMSLDENRHVQ